MWSRTFVLCVLASCAGESPSREQRIVDTLADDNYVWLEREPALVQMKLLKMQRGPYEWLRGTAALYWRDLMEPGALRATSAFLDPNSSRVLLVGDPHPENVGTYRAADGTMFVDWNDFDATGYGPYTGDLRRLGAGLAIIANDDVFSRELIEAAAGAYAARIAELAAGAPIGAVGFGAAELFDDELDKAQTRGDSLFALDELAPMIDGRRELALGDLEAVAEDGVIEDRLLLPDPEEADWLDRAVARWDPDAVIELRARRIGSGVASYAAYRFNVVLAGDRVIELKETRDGIVIRGVPQLESAEWPTPAARSVDTQRRLHARPDGDALLGHAQVGGLSLRIRDREAYQRGVDAGDLAELPRDQLLAIAGLYGGLLARAHGAALTADGVSGHSVIAPLLANREPAFVAEIADHALADAQQVIADHAAMRDRDLFTLIGGRE